MEEGNFIKIACNDETLHYRKKPFKVIDGAQNNLSEKKKKKR